MKTIFTADLKPDTGTFDDYFQVTRADRKEKKRGGGYLSLMLRDRTGEVDAKLWDIPDDFTCKAGDFVKVRAETDTYNDKLQLKVKLIKVIDRAEVAIDDFIPASKRDRLVMFDELCRVIASIKDDALKVTLADIASDHAGQIQNAPAAVKLHQAYLGGLLEHTLNICAMVEVTCYCYPELNRDVLMAGTILHDIGKIYEMQYTDQIGSTRAGRLLGHIIQGSILWDKYTTESSYSRDIDPVTRDHVAHIIASHHGQREWGAAVIPMTREAQVMHMLDQLDAKMAIMNDALAGQLDADGFTQKVYAMDTPLWNGGRV